MAGAERQPNILLIMSDEHDPGVTGCYGDPIVHTPHLDRLAAEGVVFDACYATSPLCVPARLSFTAGKYISRVAAWSNSCWLPSDDIPSVARVLTAAGYECILGGKMHYDATRRYGFTELYATSQNAFHKTGLGRRRDPRDTTPANGGTWKARSRHFHTGDTSPVMDLDLEVTRRCSAFLSQRKASDRPLLLVAGYLAPHFPLIVPREFHAHYEGRVPMPDVPDGYLESMPTNYKQLRYGFDLTDTEPAVVRRGRELYWAFVDWVDKEIGKLLGALADSEIADNTIVIYTSDHGENKGDHGTWWKNNMYEHAARVPLIVSWPRRWKSGQRRTGACSLVDLTQTLLELGGAQAPDDWDGDSMVAWLDDASMAWKDLAVSEYYGHNIASGFALLRQGPCKYVYHARMDDEFGPERELYDLEADPGEFDNLAARADRARQIEQMHAALLAELGRHPDETEQICRADYARGYGRTR
jgi:choline-sulfatase